ncbi:MAG: M42 family peptidase [Clostridia bacterium]|nr:M42 family peptidase [Clostridia bacterium]
MRTKEAQLDLLRRLSLAFGPTGCEGEVAEIILEEIKPLAHRITRDRMGNLTATVRFGDEKVTPTRIMISAHMDEVGMMIHTIREDGTLLFGTVGGIDPSVMPGRFVTVKGKDGYLQGVIASKAIHHKEKDERQKPPKQKSMAIDVGAGSREAAEALLEIGAYATFDSEWIEMGKDGNTVKCKALDDRAGCAVMILVMEALAECPPQEALELFFCFTVREEIGLSGALPVAERLRPDFSLVLESTAVADIEGVESAKQVAHLGCGGAISLMDRSTIYNRELCRFALDVARKEQIPAQIKQYVSGGNDAGHIHKSGTGVRILALSLPTRYLHSSSCVASLSDFEAMRAHTEALVRNLSHFGGRS